MYWWIQYTHTVNRSSVLFTMCTVFSLPHSTRILTLHSLFGGLSVPTALVTPEGDDSADMINKTVQGLTLYTHAKYNVSSGSILRARILNTHGSHIAAPHTYVILESRLCDDKTSFRDILSCQDVLSWYHVLVSSLSAISDLDKTSFLDYHILVRCLSVISYLGKMTFRDIMSW